MKKFVLLPFFALLLLAISSTVSAATLSLSPSSGSYTVGQIFTVNILLNTQGQAVDGVDIRYLNYNPAYLEVQDENGSVAGVQITPGTLMPMTLANNVDTTNGRITLSQITAGGTTFTNNTPQALATVRFKVLQTINSSVAFDFVSGGTTETNIASKGSDILTSVINGNYGISAQSPKPSLPAPAPSMSPSLSPSPVFSNVPQANPAQSPVIETIMSFVNYLIIIIIIMIIAAIIFLRKKKSNKTI